MNNGPAGRAQPAFCDTKSGRWRFLHSDEDGRVSVWKPGTPRGSAPGAAVVRGLLHPRLPLPAPPSCAWTRLALRKACHSGGAQPTPHLLADPCLPLGAAGLRTGGRCVFRRVDAGESPTQAWDAALGQLGQRIPRNRAPAALPHTWPAGFSPQRAGHGQETVRGSLRRCRAGSPRAHL